MEFMSISTSIIIPGENHKTLRLVLWATLLLMWPFVSCTKVDDPDPFWPHEGPLPSLVDTVNNFGYIYLDLSDRLDLSVPFTISIPYLRHGSVSTSQSGQAILFQRTDTSDWVVDSSTYQVCYGGVCREGRLRIFNSKLLLPIDTNCYDLGLFIRHVDPSGNHQLTSPAPGYIFESFGYPSGNITLTLDQVNRGLVTYVMRGTLEKPDSLYFKLRGPQGQCRTGWFRIRYGNGAIDDYFEANASDTIVDIPLSYINQNDTRPTGGDTLVLRNSYGGLWYRTDSVRTAAGNKAFIMYTNGSERSIHIIRRNRSASEDSLMYQRSALTGWNTWEATVHIQYR